MGGEDCLSEQEELEMLVRMSAARRAEAIVNREGAILATSARNQDETAIAADTRILANAITDAITDAFFGYIEGIESDEKDP